MNSNSDALLAKKVSVNIAGEWHWGDDERYFSLSLTQAGDSIFGSYCAIAQAGNRVDCADSSDTKNCMLRGRLFGDSAILAYTSMWDEGSDTAFLRFSNSIDTIFWRSEKNTIMSWVPRKAALKRL